MKTLKCPLCGEELAPSVQRYGFEYVCWKCKWQTASLCPTEQGAKKAAQKLISKFPPIMRLNQGDNVLIWLSDDIYTVLGADLEAGKIHLQDVYGDADSYYPTNIKKWPWEFDQKGGDNGR